MGSPKDMPFQVARGGGSSVNPPSIPSQAPDAGAGCEADASSGPLPEPGHHHGGAYSNGHGYNKIIGPNYKISPNYRNSTGYYQGKPPLTLFGLSFGSIFGFGRQAEQTPPPASVSPENKPPVSSNTESAKPLEEAPAKLQSKCAPLTS